MNSVNFKTRHLQLLRALRNSCVAGLLLVAADFSIAQVDAPAISGSADAQTLEALIVHYPSGSIQSADMANRALAEVETQRATLERKYAAEQHVCYSKFLASSCLDAAKERRRLALAQIRKVEVEANSFIRGARVVERDQHLAEKRANEANNPPKPATEPPAKQAASPAVQHADNESEKRIADHEAKVRRERQADKANAQNRAEDVAAYEKKARDAASRQRDVAAKKAEKERQAAAKAAASSAASAK